MEGIDQRPVLHRVPGRAGEERDLAERVPMRDSGTQEVAAAR